jgi:hypothetical protein
MKASNKLVKDRKLGTKPAAKAPPTATPPPKTKKSGTEIQFDERTRKMKFKIKIEIHFLTSNMTVLQNRSQFVSLFHFFSFSLSFFLSLS